MQKTMQWTGAKCIVSRTLSGIATLFCLLTLAGEARAEESPVLARTYYSSEQRIPLILNRPTTGKGAADGAELDAGISWLRPRLFEFGSAVVWAAWKRG